MRYWGRWRGDRITPLWGTCLALCGDPGHSASRPAHLRIDMLALRLQNLCGLVNAVERRIAQLE